MAKVKERKGKTLDEIIERVNWLPAWMGVEMPYLIEAVSGAPLRVRHAALKRSLKELTDEAARLAREAKGRRVEPDRDLEGIVRRVAKLKRYILGGFKFSRNPDWQAAGSTFEYSEYWDLFQRAEARYVNFGYTRTHLRFLIRNRDEIETLSIYRPAQPIHFFLAGKGKPETRRLRFRVEPDELLEALDGIEFDRLRECEVCRRIFWAKDERQLACPPQPLRKSCADNRRQRKSRENKRKSKALYKESSVGIRPKL